MADLGHVIRVLPAALLTFLAGAFVLPSEAAYSLVFYLAVLPALGAGWRGLRLPGAGEWLALGLILWSGLSLIWGEDDGHRSLKFATGAVMTAAFVVACRQVLADALARRRFATAIIWLGAANAAMVLVGELPVLLRGDRLLGWGITRHPILGGSVMAVAFLTALWRALSERRARGWHYAAAGVMACFIVAMQSRGALLAAAGASLVLLAAGTWRWRALSVCLVGAVVLALPDGVWRYLVARGASHRLEIWQRAFVLIRQRPLFGWGLAANLPPADTVFPHSLYVSLLFYSGAVGLALFAGLAALVSARLLRGWRRADGPWMAAVWVNGVLAGLTDLGQITKGPGEIWFIIWLPIVLALSAEL